MKVITFKNQPIDSNCYVIYEEYHKSCIIIDPGTYGSKEVIKFIDSKNLIAEYVILTHEHFDHIWGVNALVEYALNGNDVLMPNAKYCAIGEDHYLKHRDKLVNKKLVQKKSKMIKIK